MVIASGFIAGNRMDRGHYFRKRVGQNFTTKSTNGIGEIF